MSELKVSRADAWQPQTALLRVPSGRVVEVKEVDLVGLVVASDGDVPDFITGQILSALDGKPRKQPSLEINKDNLPEMFGFINTVVMAGMVKPVVKKANAKYSEGEINLGDIPTDDKLAIFNAVMPSSEVGAAKSFRQRVETANLADVPGGADDGDKAEPDTQSAK